VANETKVETPKTAQYQVLRPIELDGKLYLPKSDAEAPTKARSAGNGAIITVDASGVIELTEAQAKEMTDGQIKAVPAPAKKAPKVESK
jgi:hypothetical protein